jgi:acetylornithine deacetylase/succinyl-diaminopimelate desuccinylase-like protein
MNLLRKHFILKGVHASWIFILGLFLFISIKGLTQTSDSSYFEDHTQISHLLSAYIQHESISNNEYEAGEFISEYCSKQGFHVDHLTRDSASYNFVASLYPLKEGKPNIIFLNHIDVVPEGNSSDWTYPPFSGVIAEGSVWGRGAIDNKGMAVMQIYALQQFVEKAKTDDLPFNISILFVSAEEIFGKLGAKIVTDSFLDYLNPVLVFGEGGSGIRGIVSSNPDLVLYGVSTAAKRALWLKLTCKLNSSGHGSVPPDADANKIMIRALERLNNTARPIELTSATKRMFFHMGRLEGGVKGMALRNIGLFKPLVGSALKEEPIIYALVSNTATLTNISNPPGAYNKISEQVEATLDCRLLPDTDTEEFLKYLKGILQEDDIEIEILKETPAAIGSRPGIFYNMFSKALKMVYPNAEVAPILFPATNDNNYFRAKGIPAFGILPIELSSELLESIHSIDERMPQDLLLSGSKVYYSFVDLLFSNSVRSSLLTQKIRGTIIDKTSQLPLSGCIVVVASDTSVLGAATTNVLGKFDLGSIPIGRHKIKVFDLAYRELEVRNVVLGTGREAVLHLSLEKEGANGLVYSGQSQDISINDMAFVSTRTFAVEETERYAGSKGDPGRMVSNFAGVRGLDDTRNDMIVRGNSPIGLVWRLEGIDIPSPNHFALFGSTGGGVNIISNKILANSDFISGAMPPEYGNSVAGVFDLNLRSGNTENMEFAAESGVIVTELLAEGPLGKSRGASFLVSVRNSSFDLFNRLNRQLGEETASLIGLAGIPEYRDAAIKLNWPLRDHSNISLFGIGGTSEIEFLEEDRDPCSFSFEDHNQNVDFGTSMGLMGINYDRFIGSGTHARISVFTSIKDIHSRRDLVVRDSFTQSIIEVKPKYRNEFYKQDYGLRFVLNSRLNARHSLRYGLNLEDGYYNMIDSLNEVSTTNYRGHIPEGNIFAQWRFDLSNSLAITAGFHSAYFSLNSASSFDPRISALWRFKSTQSLAFAAGLHSSQQPSYIYLQLAPDDNGSLIRHNENLDFTRSQQYVLSYFNRLSDNIRLKVEVYYQRLSGVPVEKNASSFSLLNDGIDFKYSFPGSLKNTGVGENFGLEATLERYYNKGYYYLLTAALYNSQYEGSDLVRRHTDFNGKFAMNGLIGKEYVLGNRRNIVLGVGLKVAYAGGRRYTPLDLDASIAKQEKVIIDSLAFTEQFPNYFRTDIKLTLTINRPQFSHEVGIDLLNIIPLGSASRTDDLPDSCKDKWGISTLNPLSVTFDPRTQSIRREYQLGFLPLLYYRLEF